MNFRYLPLIVAFLMLVVSGLVHGIWTERWQTSTALEDACSRVALVPEGAGAWKSINVEVDPEPYQQARAGAYWLRRYTRDEDSGSITVILMCGRPDHMSVHTPDICYQGAGFSMAGTQTKQTVAVGRSAPAAEFWTARFRQSAKAAGYELRIYWTWSADGSWRAPSSPRWTFGGVPFLYKLYIAHENFGDRSADSTTLEFLQQFLPVLEKSLFSEELPGS